MDKNFILNSIKDLRGEDVANSLSEHAKDVSWVESNDRNIPQSGGGPARGLYQYEIKGTKDGSGASETALNRFYNYISKHNLSIPPEYEEELKNLSNRNNPDFTELSPELQSQIFYADKDEGQIPLDKLADGSLSSRDAWIKYHWIGKEKDSPAKEKQFDRAMRTRPSTIKEGSDSVDTQTDQMLSEEQPEDNFRPEDDAAPSDTGTVTGDQAEEEPGFLDTVGEYVGDVYDTASEYASETVDTLEQVAESVGKKLRRLMNSEEESSSSSDDNPPLPTLRPDRTDNPPLPTLRPDRTDNPPLPTLRPDRTENEPIRVSARDIRDMVAQQLGVYESSQEATSEAEKYNLNDREVDTLRHILGAGLLKYIGKDYTQPLLQGTELFEKTHSYVQRFLDPESEDIYRKSYYDQSIEEANRDIVNYKVGAALAKQYDTKEDFINASVELVKDLGKGNSPVVVDKFSISDLGGGEFENILTPQLSTGVVYPPEELKRRGLIYNKDVGTLTAPPVEDLGFKGPTPGPDQTAKTFSDVENFVNTLKKAEGGSVEKKVEFIKKDDDDDVPDPPPGATPEEVADDIPAYLSSGEYVLPANVVRYLGLKNITGMHQRALSELQQMEDLDIIENVDENGYVEEDDDEMDYMKPEGVVEIVVAEHHPKGLMAMGFAEGGPVEAMVYIPGVGFVPQSQAATRSSRKKTVEDTQAETREGPSGRGGTDTGKSMSEMSPMEQAAFGGSLSGPLGGAIESVSKGIVGSALGLASPLGVERGYSQATGVPTAAQQAMKSVDLDIAKAKEMYAMSPSDLSAAQSAFSGPVGNTFGATTNQMQAHEAAVAAGTAPAGSHANAAGGYSTKGDYGFSTNNRGDVVGNDPDRNGVPGDQTGTSMAGATDDAGTAGAPGMGDSTGSGVGSGVEGGAGTTGGHDDGGEDSAESSEAAGAEAEAAGAKRGGYVTRNGIMARGYSEGGMINSDSSFEEGQVLPTSDIFSEGVYAQADINRSVDSENVVESDKVITAPVAFSSAPGKTAYLAYITPEEAASLRQAKQGFSSEGNGQEVSDGQYQHLGPKGLMSFNGVGGAGGGKGGGGSGSGSGSGGAGESEGGMGGRGGGIGGAGTGSPTGGASAPSDESYGGPDAGDEGGGMGGPGGTDEYRFDEVEQEVEEKPTDPYEGYTYVKGIGYVPTSRRATSDKPIESASLALSSIFTPSFLTNIGLMSDPNEEL